MFWGVVSDKQSVYKNIAIIASMQYQKWELCFSSSGICNSQLYTTRRGNYVYFFHYRL